MSSCMGRRFRLSTFGESHGAAVGAVVKAVVEVAAKDLEAKLVTLKGPRGNYVILPVEDASLLADLKIGERGVVTYAEAVALTLEKIR